MRAYLANKYVSFLLICSCSVGYCDENLAKIVGQSLWEALPDQSSEFVATFIKGMREAKSYDSEQELFECYEEEVLAKENLLIKEQIEEADLFFKKLRQRQDLHEVIPNELYYRTVETNNGKKITSTAFVVVASYKIEILNKDFSFTPNLSEERELPLSGLIPGIAKGMIGMNEGETREIFIHPKYGYSGPAFLEGHPALIVEVKLKSISENKELEFPIEPIEFPISNVSIEDLKNKYHLTHLKLAYMYGKAAWKHYKYGDYSIEKVVDNIYRASKGDVIDLTSSSNQKKLTDLHWTIYQRQDSSP